MKPVKGVDLSEWNGNVNFAALKAAGIGFVILRCGYGRDLESQDDPSFETNVRKAEAAGIPWGAYLYSYAVDTEGALSEAEHTKRVLKGRKPAYGVWYDVEDPSQAGANLIPVCRAYCDAMQKAGYYCGIYSMLSWLEGKLSSSRLDRYDKWVAQWSGSCDYRKPYGIWQFTDELILGGKRFDANLAYKDYPTITKGERDLTEKETRKVVREEIAAYLKELGKKPTPEWAEEPMKYAKENGILNGDADGGMRPESFLKRDEFAQAMRNLCE